MEVEPEMKPRHSGRRKSDSPLTFQSKGAKTQLRPDVDVILSLKNPIYKAVMIGYFQRLGGKKNNENNEAEKEVAREALHLFKNRKRGEQTRFFKPESRYSSKSYLEVDEIAALESECSFFDASCKIMFEFLLFACLCRIKHIQWSH